MRTVLACIGIFCALSVESARPTARDGRTKGGATTEGASRRVSRFRRAIMAGAACVAAWCGSVASAQQGGPAQEPGPRVSKEIVACHPLSWEEMLALDAGKTPVMFQVHERPSMTPGIDAGGALGGVPPVLPPTFPFGTRGSPGCPSVPANTVADVSFRGYLDENVTIPPDTMGTVGPSHVVTMINARVVVQTRTGGSVSSVTLDSFWTGFGTGHFDPHIVFDTGSQRWIAVCSADRRTAAARVCVAISATSSPTGVWYRYTIDADSGDTTWDDYPALGVNQTWIAVTENMYTNANDTFQGPKLWVIDKSSVLAGGSAVVTTFGTGFDNTGGGSVGTHVPTAAMDSGAGSETIYLVANGWFSGSNKLARISRITGTGGSPVWGYVPGTPLGTAGLFTYPAGAQFTTTMVEASQLGDARTIDSGDTRVRNAVYRGGRVYWSFAAGLPAGTGTADRTAAVWAVFNPGASAFADGGALDPGAGGHLIFPSIAVNCAGDLCMGFSRLDATRFPQAAYALKPVSAGFGAVQVLKAGESFYYKTFGGTRNRWGDYSMTVVDPNDGSSFWTVQEYAALRVGSADNDSRYGVWWGRIPVGCTAPTISQHPSSLTRCAGVSATFTVAATGAPTPTYQWRKGGSPIGGATGATFTIGSPTGADQGSYDCVVTNSCSSVPSNAATLTVDPATSIGVQPTARAACLGSQTTFMVGATGGGTLGYQWRKSMSPIPGATGSTYTINLVHALDAGPYDCVVTGSCGQAISNAVALTVCGADFNCSGVADITDIFTFLTAWFHGDPRAEFDGTPGILVQDIFAFLVAWFHGC